MKTCTSCKKELSEPMFQKNKGTKDGLASQCNSCDASGKLIRSREKKQRLVDLFGGCCSKCGYKTSIQALHFHHANGGKEINVGLLARGSFEKMKKEAEKCVLLCANCHIEEHEIPLSSVVYGGNRRTKSGL
jgi:hypothetical protein